MLFLDSVAHKNRSTVEEKTAYTMREHFKSPHSLMTATQSPNLCSSFSLNLRAQHQSFDLFFSFMKIFNSVQEYANTIEEI